jgi:3-hydroxyisobutyrate dehydrogenase-like beta-hydroxyacid dehydrogenase
MALNLVKVGHRVIVYNRTPEKAETLTAQGAKPAASIAAASRGDTVASLLRHRFLNLLSHTAVPNWTDRQLAASRQSIPAPRTIDIAKTTHERGRNERRDETRLH